MDCWEQCWSTWQISGEGGKGEVSLLLSVQSAPEQRCDGHGLSHCQQQVCTYPGPGHLWGSEWQVFVRKGPGAGWGKDQVVGSWFWCGRLMCVHLIGISRHTLRHEAGGKRQEQLLPHMCPARDCPVVRRFLSLLLRNRVLRFIPSPSCLFMGPSQLSRKQGKQASCAAAAGLSTPRCPDAQGSTWPRWPFLCSFPYIKCPLQPQSWSHTLVPLGFQWTVTCSCSQHHARRQWE